MSLHGTHRGTAMLLESPTTFRITPMMINTRLEGAAGPVQPGEWDLIPSGSYGMSRGATPPPGNRSLYSPMLECPCTDRKVGLGRIVTLYYRSSFLHRNR